MPKDIYVLGTGLSHNGSAVILKNGIVEVAIEKERLSRIKHDGGNDTLAINYCLEALDITIEDIAVTVQCENFVTPEWGQFGGSRIFKNQAKTNLYTISHHLAHAYSTIGTSPFEQFNVMIIDGCGSPYEQCIESLSPSLQSLGFDTQHQLGLVYEKDSFYCFDGNSLTTVYKDFSELEIPGSDLPSLPTTKHSIGGFYALISNYCFGNMNDAGKLMGLAPFGRPGMFEQQAFNLSNGRVFVRDEWKTTLHHPSQGHHDFRDNFQHYADIACWAQNQVEKTVLYVIQERLKLSHNLPLCYSGGVALNAVTNAKILNQGLVNDLYIEPAAADNGLALGCAYYGWLEILKKERVGHDGNTCFGKTYSEEEIGQELSFISSEYKMVKHTSTLEMLKATAKLVEEGKTVGWFQDGCEFGPRALGKRSIIASPFKKEMQAHINGNIKFREDFRPFAPAVLREDVNEYFEQGLDSPYMILVDQVKARWKDKLKAVSHVDGSARVQTVSNEWNSRFYQLLRELKTQSGHGLALNTSFNKRGQPIVETPKEAVSLFLESAIDVLVMENWMVFKPTS